MACVFLELVSLMKPVGSFKNRASSTKSLCKYNDWEKKVVQGSATRKTWMNQVSKKKTLSFASTWSIVDSNLTLLISFVGSPGSWKVPRPVGQLPRRLGKNCLLWLDLLIALRRDVRDWWAVYLKPCRTAVFLKVRNFRKSVRWILFLVYCLVMSYADPFRPPPRFN